MFETPEAFAARVLRDERFVPGVPVAFLACGALRQPPGGGDSFAKLFEDASGVEWMWATEADVWQTADGLIHATETVVTQDGRIFPVFDNNKGTGQWSLRNRGTEVGALGSELRTAVNDFHRDRGRQVEARGSELRTAVNDSAVPRHPEGAHSAPVFKWAGTPGPSGTSRTAGNEERNERKRTRWARDKEKQAALVADGRALLEKLTTRQAELKALPELDAEQAEEWNALPGRIAEVQANVAAVEQKEADRKAKNAAAEKRRYERTKRGTNELVEGGTVLLEELMVQRAPLAVLAELTVLDTDQRAELEELDASIEEVRNELATIANEEQDRKARHAESMKKQRDRKKRGQADALASLAAARAGRAKLEELPGFKEVLQLDPDMLPEFYKEPRRQWEALQREEAAALEVLHEHERMHNQVNAQMRKFKDRYKDEWAQESKSLRELMARQAKLEVLTARDETETRGEELAELEGLPGRIAEVQAKLPAIAKLEAERKAKNAEKEEKRRARKKANTLLATFRTRREELVESGAGQVTELEKVQGSIAALEAELAAIENDDMGSGATARGNGGADREPPAGVVELVGLVGRVEGHLSVLPKNFRPDVHEQVEQAWAMAKKGSWTRADPARIDSKLGRMRDLERWLSEVVRSPGVVELEGLVGRLEGHLSMVPADVLLDVRAGVVKAKAMARQGSWTPKDRAWIDSKLAGMRKGEQWLAEVVSSPGVVEFVGLVERLEGHLSVLSAGFRPDVRAGVAQAKAMAQKGNWTPEELSLIASNLGRMRKLERWLRLEPVVFGVHPDVVKLASGLRGVQVVGVHVTPDGQAQSADDVLETPEDFAERVLRDERFVPGVPVAFLACGALRQPPGGKDSFAKRFEDASGVELMLATEADVWQTADGLIHATETVVTQDGRIFPVFDNNKGTGYWSLREGGREVGALGSELRAAVNDFHRDRGRQVEVRGSELRTAVNDSAVPSDSEGAPPAPVFKWAGTPGPSGTSRTAENEERNNRKGTRWARYKEKQAALVADGRALLEKLTTRQAELKKALPGLDEEQVKEWDALPGRIAEVQANVAAVEQKEADRKARNAASEKRRYKRTKREQDELVDARKVLLEQLMVKRAPLAVLAELTVLDTDQRAELEKLDASIEEVRNELATIANEEQDRKEKNAERVRKQRARKKRGQADALASLAAAEAGRAKLKELPGFTEVLQADPATLPEFDREDRRRWEAWQREEAAALEVLHDHERMRKRNRGAARMRKSEDRYKDEWAQESKSLRELMARQAQLETLMARDETWGEELAELAGLPGRIAEVQAKLPAIAKLEAERKAKNAEKEKKSQARRKANTLLATLKAQRAKLVESDSVQGPEWEEVQGSIAALEAELAAIENDDTGSGATARGNGGADREAPAGVVELVGLVGRVEGHLSVLPAGFRPDLHVQVEEAWAMAKKGSWTRADPARIDSQLERMWKIERWLGAVVSSPGVVELEGLVGRAEEHLSMVPADVLLDVRAGVVKAKAMARQGSWTPKDRAWIDSKLAGMRKGERWLAEVVSSPGVVEFVGLVERLEGHLSVLPADFRPDVRAGVVQAKAMAKKGNWTPEELSLIASNLGRMRKLERWLRLEPVVFGVHPDVVKLASGLRGVQVVGVHVTPDGQAQSADDVLETPEDFAARVLSDERFVPGVPVAFLGCGALRQPPGGGDSFAKRFEDASGVKLMLATEADVWHTDDGLIHATETGVTQDGRIFPVFDNNKGTGYWSLREGGREVGALGSELRAAVNDFHRDRGRQVEARGSELRTAVNDSAVPRHPEGAPPAPVFKWAGSPGPSGTSRTAGNEERNARDRKRRARKKAEEAALVADGRALLEKLTTRQAELKALPGLDEEQAEEWNALPGRIAEVQANVAAVEQKEADQKARNLASQKRRYKRTKREQDELVDARKELLEQLMVQRAPLAELAELTVLDTNQRAELEELDASIEEVRNELATIANEEKDRKEKNAENMRRYRDRKNRGLADARASLAAARAGRAKLEELPGFTEVLQLDPDTLPEFYKEPRRQWEALQREEAAALELLHEHERMRNQGVARMRKFEDRYKDEWAQESKSLRELMARQAQLETLMARNETRGRSWRSWRGCRGVSRRCKRSCPRLRNWRRSGRQRMRKTTRRIGPARRRIRRWRRSRLSGRSWWSRLTFTGQSGRRCRGVSRPWRRSWPRLRTTIRAAAQRPGETGVRIGRRRLGLLSWWGWLGVWRGICRCCRRVSVRICMATLRKRGRWRRRGAGPRRIGPGLIRSWRGCGSSSGGWVRLSGRLGLLSWRGWSGVRRNICRWCRRMSFWMCVPVL
ncbi:hypothetical protein [Saccharopolyspora sp. ASAGF58]|uniref:hypothetical protein n=1 Tax=Saccharopolyspora sp. ASAGF58 TaxID=2719023 RepID=UPI00143FCCDA|nr:hypothetical protein [Saccharopolyspora sp. ASAGF58]QIZ37494.1 hypothetical protein FDZ84_26530 [Saccharopolyspora sp. ASAGF58]